MNVNIHTVTINCSNLSIKWNSKYMYATAAHSAMSTGYEYVLWRKMPVVQIYHKMGLQNIMHSVFAGSANRSKTTLKYLNTREICRKFYITRSTRTVVLSYCYIQVFKKTLLASKSNTFQVLLSECGGQMPKHVALKFVYISYIFILCENCWYLKKLC
jgi:hypothetical protein